MRSSFLRLWLLRSALSLPTAVLRFLSGGGVVFRDGRTLDPQMQFLWRSWFAPAESSRRMPLTLAGKSIDVVREEWRDMAALLEAPAALKVRVETVGEPGTSVGVTPISGLLIRPSEVAADAPVLVFFPQGGGVLGGPELSRAFCSLFAAEARCPIFIPTLRLAPEARFPAALEDARIALEWSQANAFRLGAASGEVAVGGILTGAGLAARLCFDLKREFKPLPVAQLLITPLVDLSDSALSSNLYADQWPLSSGDLSALIAYYAGGGLDLADPKLSPLNEALIVGQPRTFVVSAGLDPLAAQAETFAQRLIKARTRTLYRRYDTLPLGFDLFAGVVDEAREATLDIARNWAQWLKKDAAPDAEARNAA